MINWNNTCAHKSFEVIKREEKYLVLGESITIIAKVEVCQDCGSDVFDFKLDDENIKCAFAKFKNNHGLLSSEEITDLRKKYESGSTTLAELLGCSQDIIAGYESGNIQSRQHDNAMRTLARA